MFYYNVENINFVPTITRAMKLSEILKQLNKKERAELYNILMSEFQYTPPLWHQINM